MIRQSLEVVPTVQPKYRLEEDARRAAKREQQQEKPLSVDRYTIARSPEAATGVRLFSLLPSPELQSRVPKTLHVLETSKKTWKRVRRMVYRATLRNRNAEDESEDEDDEADGSAPRFSSLPLPEYENMSCVVLKLPTENETDETTSRVVQAKSLDVPLHALRYERTEVAKAGQGISTSWYSGVDVRAVRFKRSYIDDDDDDDEGNMHCGYFSDDGATEIRQDGSKREDKSDGRIATAGGSKKKKKLEEANNITRGTEEEASSSSAAVVVVAENKLEKDGVLKLSNGDAPVSPIPSSTLQTSEAKKNDTGMLNGSEVEGNVLERLTASQLQEWSAAGKAAMPFTELTKIVLKSHPHYAEMKAKHQSPQGRQEAVEWFRVSQNAVRKHVLHLGYTIDSSNNIYLSQQKKG
ncbi:hypothetical protein LSM04_008581 [Trypanosoma melophagium]|uniref:uncharacterized protein n=1 Tax=Trypanosoma melophagium TaxID=715481 RepID=UPI00351A7A07|nr:hypothetical protein LSM04_008581 [Trypanosoma melophagium]